MKKVALFLIIFFPFLFTSQAQTSLSLYSGLGRSSFDENLFGSGTKISQAEYVPVGAQLTFNVLMLSLGAEFNYAAVPYTFDLNFDVNGQNTKVADLKIHQMFIGAVAKVKLLPGPIVPYARAGLGLISGNADINYTSQIKQLAQQNGQTINDTTLSIKNALGINLGAGIEINFSESGGLFGEIVYYFIQREQDIKGAQSFQANNYALQVGWQFKF